MWEDVVAWHPLVQAPPSLPVCWIHARMLRGLSLGCNSERGVVQNQFQWLTALRNQVRTNSDYSTCSILYGLAAIQPSRQNPWGR